MIASNITKYLRTMNLLTRISFCPIYIINQRSRLFYEFSSSEDDSTINKINVSEEEVQKIKKLLTNHNLQDIQKDGQDFFSKEEIQLSLKIMQIDNIDQLKAYIIKYSNRFPPQNADQNKYDQQMAEIMRCKFIIMNKYINLGGKVVDKEIQPIYRHLSSNINSLDQNFITKFYRIIANEIKSNPRSILSPPALPLIENATHTNSELIALLLMVYPQIEDKIYIHYNLKPNKKGESYKQGHIQSQKQIIYDPIHLIHMLKHFFHYQDVQQLFHKSMTFSDFESCNYQFDQLIKSQDQLKSRRIQAMNYALIEGLQAIYEQHLFRNPALIEGISLSQSLILLKNILTAKKHQNLISKSNQNIVFALIEKIIDKSQTIIEFSEQQQQKQNQNFKHAVQIVSLFLSNKQTSKKDIITQLITHIFGNNLAWRIRLQEYSEEQLFSILVCYKGCKDLIKNQKNMQIDQDNAFLIKLLINFKAEIECLEQYDQKHIFYVCYFADSYGCVQYLKSQKIQLGLLKISKQKNIKKISLDIIQRILDKFRAI